MKSPVEPKPEDCCNSGCNPCIFDVYEKQLKLYECYRESGHTDLLEIKENGITQLEYTEFCVIDNIDLENEHRLILFRKTNSSKLKVQVTWNPGDHFLLKYESSKQTCSRAYTPLKIDLEAKHDFAILIKMYSNGVVSLFLSGLNKGDVTLWRGPYGHYNYIPNQYSRIIMIAQGTGLVPVYNIVKKILNNDEDMTKVILVYCCKNLKTVLLRDELYLLKSFWNFQYEVYLSDKPKETCKYQEPIHNNKCDISCISKFKPFTENEQFILCGSEQFMDHFKQLLLGAKVREENIIKF